MKRFSACLPMFVALMFVLCAMAGCKTTSASERPNVCTVLSVSGEARCRDGQSNKLHVIKNGDQIPQGSIIETAKGPGNFIDMAMGERLQTVYSNYPRIFDPTDSVRVNEDSVLKLDKVALRTAGKNRILDTRLDLSRGSILIEKIGRLQEPWLQAGLITPIPNASHWELRSSSCVLHAQGGAIFFSATGLIRVLWGTAIVERINEKTTTQLTEGQQYDAANGNIGMMDKLLRMELLARPDFPPPPETQKPRFIIPQRSF